MRAENRFFTLFSARIFLLCKKYIIPIGREWM